MDENQHHHHFEGNNRGYTVNQYERVESTNGMGVAGFVLALLALFLFWVPFLGWLLWLLGLIFSLVGVFKAPRGFAIAGLIILILDFFLFILGIIALIGILS